MNQLRNAVTSSNVEQLLQNRNAGYVNTVDFTRFFNPVTDKLLTFA